MPNLYVLIPVLNEAENISLLATNLKSFLATHAHEFTINVIFINDGSVDSTCKEINTHFFNYNFTILHHEKNYGPGKAFATGFSYLENCLKPGDWVLTLEGDNTGSHATISKMFHRAKEGYDVILASPYLYGGTILNTTKFRKFLSFGANIIFKELLGLRGIATVSSFFRLYKAEVILKMQQLYGPGIIESKGFEGVVELLMKLVFANTTISEIPLVLDTSKRKGASKMRIFKTTVSWLRLLRFKAQLRNEYKKLVADRM